MTNQPPVIEQLEVDGEAVQKVVFDNLMPALDQLPLGLAITSMLAFCVLLMKPNISGDGLSEVLGETSKFIVMMLASIEQAPEDGPVTLN